jgi:hypothetical protein
MPPDERGAGNDLAAASSAWMALLASGASVVATIPAEIFPLVKMTAPSPSGRGRQHRQSSQYRRLFCLAEWLRVCQRSARGFRSKARIDEGWIAADVVH